MIFYNFCLLCKNPCDIYIYTYIYNKYITNNIAIYNITKYITIYNICNKCLQTNISYIYIYTYSSPFFLATPQSQCLMVIGRDGSLSTLCHSCGLWAYVSEEGLYIYLYIYKPIHSLEFIRSFNFKFHAFAIIRGKKLFSFTRIFLCSSLKTFILIDSRTSGNTNISFNHCY